MKTRVGFLVLVVVLLAACGRADVNVQRNPEGGVTVTVSMTEQDVNAVVGEALAEANPLLREPVVDLQIWARVGSPGASRIMV